MQYLAFTSLLWLVDVCTCYDLYRGTLAEAGGLYLLKFTVLLMYICKEFNTNIENALRFGIESYSGLHTCRLLSGCVVRGSSRVVFSYKFAVVKVMIGFRPILSQTL